MKLLRYLAALACPLVLTAQTVNLSVNANHAVRTVDARVFGVNSVVWDGQTSSAPTLTLLQAAGVGIVRLPGGSAADVYHWVTNTDQGSTSAQSAGFNNFSALVSGIGAQAFVTVNYGSGTPQEAAAWVAYANRSSTLLGTSADVTIGVDANGFNWQTAGFWSSLRAAAPLAKNDGMNFLRLSRASPFALKYWEIGNECYGSWEEDLHTLQWDPVTYATVAKTYITQMKAVDPTIKIGVVAETGEDSLDSKSPVHNVTNPVTGATHHGWTPVTLTTLKTAPAVTPDFLIYHRYEQGPGGETDAGLLQAAQTWPSDAANLRLQLNDYLGSAAGPTVEIDVTENNSVYSNPGKQTTSLVNGLYMATSMGNVLQTEINSLVWWDLRNGQETTNNNSAALYGWRQYGDYGILPSSGQPYPTYYAMKLLAQFARGGDTVIQATSSSTLLSIFATKRANGNLSLLIINKSPTSTTTANIAVTGFSPGPTATTYTYGEAQDTNQSDLLAGTMTVSGSLITTSFLPYSLNVITLSPGVPPTLTNQPASQSVANGTIATFSAAASGTPTPTLQWQRLAAGTGGWINVANGGSYAGATTANLTVSPAAVTMNGDQFQCVATNVAGTVASTAALLTVYEAPVILTPPANQTITTGETTLWTIDVSANPTATYSWQFLPLGGTTWVSLTNDNVTYFGVNSATLAVLGTTMAGNGGQFQCVVSNVYGTTVSSPVTLAVQPPTYAAWTSSLGLVSPNDQAAATPFPDGLPNLVHYAMNLGATPTASQLPQLMITNAGVATYQFRELKGLSGMQLTVQTSPDLITWTTVAPAGLTELADDDANTARFEALVPMPANGTVFFRVLVTESP